MHAWRHCSKITRLTSLPELLINWWVPLVWICEWLFLRVLWKFKVPKRKKTKLSFGILGFLKQRAARSSITEMQVHRLMLMSQRGSCQLLQCRYETVITAWRTNRRVFFPLILLLAALACSHLHVCVRVRKVGKWKTGLPHRGPVCHSNPGCELC